MEHAKQDGVPKAAKDLRIAQAMLFSWQAKSRQTGQPFEEQKLQQAEIARLKRENARLKEVVFLKNCPTGMPTPYAKKRVAPTLI